MKKVTRISPTMSVTTFSSPSGPLYELYVNGAWYNGYSSLEEVISAMTAIIEGVADDV